MEQARQERKELAAAVVALQKTCERIELRIDAIDEKLAGVHKSASNMDRHVSLVESFILPIVNPFNRIRARDA